MLYIIGLGLNEKGLSLEAVQAIEKCSRVYLENYTTDFPYNIKELGISEETAKLARGDVESNRLIEEAKKEDVALLVYGSPLFATTHISLVIEAEKAGVKVKIIHAASIFDVISETGLQLYKFGKIASMPDSSKDKEESNFLEYVKDNMKINAHSLILIDIGMKLEDALNKLEKAIKKNKIKIDKILICSKMGTKRAKILYGEINELRTSKIKNPFCFIIPSELHFLEKEGVERFG